ncbi:MAG: anthranilate phosphoribosyltransferase, partial [Candidatus Thermoplasmatota archaeon]
HGIGGIAEISTISKTLVGELKNGETRYYEISPREFNLEVTNLDKIKAEDVVTSAEIAKEILRGKLRNERLDIVLLNSAAGIYVSGKCDTIQEGIELAKESIESGKAYEKLKSLVKATKGDLSKLE